ncbi:MAG TPA: glycoside hydrolase family 3 C-terminal domain-containing protein [Pseudomonadales bacterium]
MLKRYKAFDAAAVHDGNRGLAIDHDAVAARVAALIAGMTLEQKLHELRGWRREPIDGLYHSGGNEALGIAPLKMVDGPRGVRAGTATAFPVAIARGASFDVLLERRIGLAIGREVAARGGNVLLAPCINLLRHPGWGRAQETYSEDPHHMGAMAVAFVSGAQNHVLASPKHFALNNLENTRFELSADVDERTLRELYLPHFERCVVEAAAASVMSAYNKVNGVYCGEHPELLTRILREEWGFRGFVESDWILGTRSTAPALKAGLDIEMPAPYRFTDANIEAALALGELERADIDRAVAHVLQQKIGWGLDRPAAVAADVVECDAHVALAREAAEKSLVLLKNAHDLLPLEDRAGLTIAVVGELADLANLGDRGSSMVQSSEVTTVLAGLRAAVGHAEVLYVGADEDWSCLADADVTVAVAGLTYRDEGEFIPTAQQQAEGGALARGGDRVDLALPAPQRRLIERAAEHGRRVVVVLEGGSAITMSEWIDRVDAVLMAWYPGREGGHAVAAALLGRSNAFGRLPVSIPQHIGQLMPWDPGARHVPHDLLHGYRWLDHHGLEPAFPFGYGLCYTRFTLEELRVTRAGDGFLVEVTVRNAGTRAGAAIPQLYVSCRESAVFRPPKELKGFGRLELAAGESAVLEVTLADRDLRYFDERAHGWRLEPCVYELRVGQSSRDLPLASVWRFDGTDWQELG